MKKESEKLLEKNLRLRVKRAGGLALKFASPFFTGMPDRFVFMPEGMLWVVEMKTTGGKLSPRQQVVKRVLEKLGFRYRIVDTQEKLNQFITEITS